VLPPAPRALVLSRREDMLIPLLPALRQLTELGSGLQSLEACSVLSLLTEIFKDSPVP